MDEMAWRAVLRIQRQAQHLLCHIQARVNVGSFVAASSSGPADSIRMEAAGGQFDGTRPDQAGPERARQDANPAQPARAVAVAAGAYPQVGVFQDLAIERAVGLLTTAHATDATSESPRLLLAG